CFRQNVVYTSNFKYCTHRTTCDYTSTFCSRLHVNFRARMATFHRVVKSTFVQSDRSHVTTRFFHCFLDRCRYFTSFAVTETYTTVTVTNYSQCSKAHDSTTFNRLRNAVNGD